MLVLFGTHAGGHLLDDHNPKSRIHIASTLKYELKKRYSVDEVTNLVKLSYFDPVVAGAELPPWIAEQLGEDETERVVALCRSDVHDLLRTFHGDPQRPCQHARTT